MKRLDDFSDFTVLENHAFALSWFPDGDIHRAKSSARITWLGNTTRNAGYTPLPAVGVVYVQHELTRKGTDPFTAGYRATMSSL